MNIKLDKHGIAPQRAHGTDAGIDLFAPRKFSCEAYQRRIVRTGVHVELPHNTVGYIRSKSGLMLRNGIIVDGTIDEGYTGEICVIMFNTGDKDAYFERGDKIAQLVIHPVLYPGMVIVEELQKTERGDNGFGSTGR